MTEHTKPRPPQRRQTRAVHGGTARSRFDETCEAIFFTSGFVYETAEDAEAAFNNARPRYQYSRFGNPTVAMFEARMCELEGAAAARATASGMAAVFASLMSQLKVGDRVVSSDALFGSCHYIIAEILPLPVETGLFYNVNLPHLDPEQPDPEIVHCPLDPRPLPLSFRHEDDNGGLFYNGDYHNRPRIPGADVDVCFRGAIAVTAIRLF